MRIRMGRDDWIALLVAVMTVTGFVLVLGSAAWGQDHTEGHMRFHAEYQNWKQPGSEASCCNARVVYPNGAMTGDCYPTPFKLIGGHWQALRAKEDGGGWIDVPDAKIIRQHNPDPSGVTGHLCYSLYAGVLCAVPPTGAF